jgi:metallo-beta-lactamase class B
MKICLMVLLLTILTTIQSYAADSLVMIDRNIGLTKLTNKAFLVQSSFACNGRLDCNHLIVLDGRDMVLINTPASDSLTTIMLNLLENKFRRKITKVIVSHFHKDSSGGLRETSKRGITSYGLDLTNNLLRSENKKLDVVFKDSMTISPQSIHLDLFYFGAGHSIDNILIWVPGDKILFGGCLLKSLEAKDKGNIKDADLHAWPETIKKVKARFKDARIVIPGHMAIGDSLLFEQTLRLVKM